MKKMIMRKSVFGAFLSVANKSFCAAMAFICAIALPFAGAFAAIDINTLPINTSVIVPDGVSIKLNDIAKRDASGRIEVSGSLGYWNNKGDNTQGNYTASREAAFDGNEATFFDPSDEANKGPTWAGIELDQQYYIFKIRYKGRSDTKNQYIPRRIRGCHFQGANLPDFSDAETLAIADVDNDRPVEYKNTTWTGTNFWCEIDIPFDCTAENPFSKVVRERKTYKYLRIYAPNVYSGGNTASDGQNGMCCGNVAELEFYGLPLQTANSTEGFDADEYKPVVSGQTLENNILSFQMGFNFIDGSPSDPAAIAAIEAGAGLPATVASRVPNNALFGYEVFRELPGIEGDRGYAIVGAGFMMGPPVAHSANYMFADENPLPGAVYHVRAFNITNDTPFANFTMPRMNVRPKFLTIATSTSPEGAILSWEHAADNTNQVTGVAVYRGFAPGGPWTRINDDLVPLSQHQYIDSDVPVGPKCYYIVRYVFEDALSGGTYTGPESNDVMYQQSQSIERVWNEDHTASTLKPGMKAICQFKPWNADDSMWQNLNNEFGNYAGDPAHLFDGDITTFSDIQPKDGSLARGKARDQGDCKAGIDLGAAYVITKARIHPRKTTNNSEKQRFAKLGLFASNIESFGESDGWRDDANCTQLTSRFQNPNPYESYYEVMITNSTPFRYVFVKHANMTAAERGSSEAFANAAELELYGYPADSADGIHLQEPQNVAYEVYETADNPVGKKGLAIAWEAGANAESYCIVRRMSEHDDWTLFASGITDLTYFFETNDVEALGEFKVGSVRQNPENPEEKEYAFARRIYPYKKGSGTGLWAVYTCPYEKNIHQSKEWIKRVDPVIDFNWGDKPIIPECDYSTNDVYITWSGKLIVPITGVYTFSSKTEDGVALRIDKISVFNNWSGDLGEDAKRGDIYLEAGEYKIRVDYRTVVTAGRMNNFCDLEWAGPVAAGVIPSTQFIPEPLAPMSYPWMGERTFEAIVKGYSDFMPTTNLVLEVGKDGIERMVEKEIDGFEISAAGGDFWLQETAAHMVWRMVTGDFLISAKFERQVQCVPGLVNDSGWAWKGQLVARKDLGLQSPVVCASYASNGMAGRADLKIRNSKGTDINDYEARTLGLPSIVYQKLERQGNVFTQAFSEDGENWNVVKTYVDEENLMDGVLYVGPAVSSILNLKQLGTYRVTMVKVVSDSGSGIVYVR